MPVRSAAGFHAAGPDLGVPRLQFRRRPPQSNYPSGRVSPPVSGGRLERQNNQGSISLLPPPQPKPRLPSHLPMLPSSSPSSCPEFIYLARHLSPFLRPSDAFPKT